MKTAAVIIVLSLCYSIVQANDTLYFRVGNPYKSEKNAEGEYLRKAIFIKDSGWLAMDFNDSNKLVAR